MHYSYYDPRYPIRWATQGDRLYLVHKGHKVRMDPSGERSWRGRIDRKDYYDFFGKLHFDQNMSAEARYLIRAFYKKEKALSEIKRVQMVIKPQLI